MAHLHNLGEVIKVKLHCNNLPVGYSGFIIGHHFHDVLKRLICTKSVIFIIDFMKTLWIKVEFEMDAFIMRVFFYVLSV